jgi:hypothetical protein
MEMDERTMIDLNAIPLLVLLPVSLAGGFALGLAYFRVLQISADLLVRGQRPLLALALMAGRFALVGAGLYGAVLAGGLVLLAAFAGVLCAKSLMLRKARGAIG